ncbi:MAG: peptidylprolyl isomerase [Candidatus Woesearchaeota archaeon]
MEKSMKKKNVSENKYKEEAKKYVKKNFIINISLLLVFIFLFISTLFIIFLNTREMSPNDPSFLKSAYSFNERLFKKEKMPVAIVNGEKIDFVDIEKRYNSLPDIYKSVMSYDDILNQVIDEKILLQEAKKENILVTEEEINTEIQNILAYNGLSETDLINLLKERNMSINDLKNLYQYQLLITKLLNKTILSKIIVNDKEIKDYYDENIELFKVPETINVSHLIICHNESIRCVSDLSKEESYKLIQKIKKEIDDSNEAFDFFVRKYSNEPNVNITNGNLGWLSKKDNIDKDFLTNAFNMTINETRIVETQFGYHIIKVFDKKPEEIIKLDKVKDQINQSLYQTKAEELYLNYLSELRNKSTINIFLNLSNYNKK